MNTNANATAVKYKVRCPFMTADTRAVRIGDTVFVSDVDFFKLGMGDGIEAVDLTGEIDIPRFVLLVEMFGLPDGLIREPGPATSGKGGGA